MRRLMNLLPTMLCCALVCLAVPSVTSAVESDRTNAVVNRIEGIVWDPYRRPVSDLYVELQNENYLTVSRTRTDSVGRFSFIGIPAGHYNVKILTTGTDYLEYSESVDIIEFVSNAADGAYLDIYLKYDKRKVSTGLPDMSGAVFVQDVPDAARKLYLKGRKDINEKGDKGLLEMEEALKLFPDYYDALNTLGLVYVERKEYQKAVPYLIRSIDINRRSFSSFYSLAYAAYQLNHRPEALEAARAATILQGNSLNAQLLYGKLLREDGKYQLAEKALLEAKKLSKNRPVPEVHWQLALLYNKLGRNKEAADELEAYIKVQPDARDKKQIQEWIAKLRREPPNSKSHFKYQAAN